MSESIKARRALLDGLEKILATNRDAIAVEEAQHAELTSRKDIIETKKREVEDGIMRGLSADSSPATGDPNVKLESKVTANGGDPTQSYSSLSTEPERPRVEELTPPPMESVTPAGSPSGGGFQAPAEPIVQHGYHPNHTKVAPPAQPPYVNQTAGADLLSSLSMPPVRHYAGSPGAGSAFKKRKLEPDFSGFGGGEDAMADLDEDVAELLRAESAGH